MPNDQPVSLLSRALDQAERVIAGVRPDQADLPTPCRSWTVRQLVAHMISDLSTFVEAAAGGRPDWSAPAAQAAEDWAGAFRAGARELSAAWDKAGDLSGTTTLPGMGEVPARLPVDMQMSEFAVHAWDLATATGQRTDLDPEIAEAALEFLRNTLAPQFRGAEQDGMMFGPEVPAAADATPYERLAAYAGRDAGR